MKYGLLLACLLMTSVLLADSSSKLNIKTTDSSVNTYPYQLKVSPGTLTDNGDGTATLTTGGGVGGSGGYAVEPATVTFILPLGVLGSTATFQATSISSQAFSIKDTYGAYIFRVDNTPAVSTDTLFGVTSSTATTWSLGVATDTVTGPWGLHISSSGWVRLEGSDAPTDSRALCMISGALGHCTSIVGVGGDCTCVSP